MTLHRERLGQPLLFDYYEVRTTIPADQAVRPAGRRRLALVK